MGTAPLRSTETAVLLTGRTSVEKCLETLRVLVTEGNAEFVGLAEQAIEEFLVTERDTDGRLDALNVLEGELSSISQNIYGPSLAFASILFESIEAHRRALRELGRRVGRGAG